MMKQEMDNLKRYNQINIKLEYYQIRMMNQQSMTSFNKITAEMDRLSHLMNKQQMFRQQMQQALANQCDQSQQSQSGIQNLEAYFKEYNNPTTKSLPFQEEIDPNSRIFEDESETINTIYRNRLVELSEDGDRQHLHDDKSTVILAGLRSQGIKQKQEQTTFPIKASTPNYSSVNNESQATKKQGGYIKIKKPASKNALSSMPSQVIISKDYQRIQNHVVKNNSLSKQNLKNQSPLISSKKNKKGQEEIQQEGANLLKQLKGKLSKIGKIDREELNRLQEKKLHKKNEPSSTRKKTKRQLGNAKSTLNMAHHTKVSAIATVANYASTKNSSNISCKKFDKNKKQVHKKEEKLLLNHQDWQRMEKTSKKLNRINICKLQENLKKAHQKKPINDVSINKMQKKEKKGIKFNSHHKEKQELKLHFTEGNQDSNMKKLIEEKQISREYTKQTNKYMQITKKLSRSFFEGLMKECRQTSQEAILKIKLVTIILYFFDQFTQVSLLTHNVDSNSDQFFTRVAQEQIIQVLLHPKKILSIIENLPTILMNDNIMSADRICIFRSKFTQINEQLEQQLEFFLIKKSTLYTFVHTLFQYINFLIQKDLIAQTKRTKITLVQNQQGLYGFYSSRSKRDELSRKGLRKNEGGQRAGYRCDSDRKITLEDEQFCFKELSKIKRKQGSAKANALKKVFK